MKFRPHIPKIFKKKKNYKYELLALSLFTAVAWVYFFQWGQTSIFLLIATMLGIYMAMNLWANDVANNMGPAVWSKALTLTWAIIIAAIFEASWALIAGWDVVNTIKWGIIDPDAIWDPRVFISIMMSTLIWAAIWMNVATFFRAPVSATHSIIWALLWAWIVANRWFDIVNWWKVLEIVISWIVSPILWWLIASILLMSIIRNIIKKDDRAEAAKEWVPIYVGIMAWAFTTYLIMKWLKQIVYVTPEISLFLWAMMWTIVFIWSRIYLDKHSSLLKNNKNFINKLFNLPLIFAVALLSFAHWANDVANAIWPLAAIDDVIKNWGFSGTNVWIPIWIMILWWLWIAAWLMVFWARLIERVWNEITKLNQIRAFSVALSAAITVIIASQLWLPVSSTHIAIGWVFWIGLTREYLKRKKGKNKEYIAKEMIKHIALAWIITLPISAIISAISFHIIIYYV